MGNDASKPAATAGDNSPFQEEQEQPEEEPERPPLDPNDPRTWGVEQAYLIFAEYEEGGYDMGVTQGELSTILTAAIEGLEPSYARELYYIFDRDSSGILHICELMSALCIEARGSVESKVNFLFKVYDFDRGGDMGYDELTILLNCVLVGIIKMTGEGRMPEDAEMELLTDEVFLEGYKGSDGTISKEEFHEWAHALLVDTPNPTPTTLLEKFGLKEAKAPADDGGKAEGG